MRRRSNKSLGNTKQALSFLSLCFNFVSHVTDTERLPHEEKYVLTVILCIELFKDTVSHFVNPANLHLEIDRKTLKLTSKSDRQSYLHFYYDLLRYTCNISPHKNGWGNPPNSKDNCVAACIERIKFKNDEILSKKSFCSCSTCQDILRNIRNDIVEVERQVIGGQLYERRIDDLFSTDTAVVNVMDLLFRNAPNMEPGIYFFFRQSVLLKCFKGMDTIYKNMHFKMTKYFLCLLI